MTLRTTKSNVTFLHHFTLAGHPDKLPAGKYEIVVEEELLDGLSFDAYRRTATYLVVARAGRTEMRKISRADLEDAVTLDRALAEKSHRNSEAALSPPEDYS